VDERLETNQIKLFFDHGSGGDEDSEDLSEAI
jgi:hypothetical protein